MSSRRTCYITCPAYAVRGPLERMKVIDSATWFCKQLQLEAVASPLLDRHMGNGSWLPAKERQEDILRALDHHVVWACRGGFGSVDLAETLLASRRRQGPLLIGYSDITVLHACWQAKGWQHHLYGNIPSRTSIGRQGESLLNFAKGRGMSIDHRVYANGRPLRPGRAVGSLFPACLSVLAGLCGTPIQPDLHGAVLAIEDIDVHPFLIDFNLNQLALSGVLDGVVALLCGSFDCQERPDYAGPTVDEVLARWAQRLRVPLVTRLPFGHLTDALVLPFGRRATLSVTGTRGWSLKIAPYAGELPWR